MQKKAQTVSGRLDTFRYHLRLSLESSQRSIPIHHGPVKACKMISLRTLAPTTPENMSSFMIQKGSKVRNKALD